MLFFNIIVAVALSTTALAQVGPSIDDAAEGFNLSRCFGTIDLGFLIDSSNSIGSQRFGMLTDFLERFIDASDIRDGSLRVGALTFSKESNIEFTMDQYEGSVDSQTRIASHLGGLIYLGGTTNTAAGLKDARLNLFSVSNGDRPDVPDLAVLIVNGESNANSRLTIPQADKLKKDGVYIFGIAVGPNAYNSAELRRVVSNPSEIIFVNEYEDLASLAFTIYKLMCPVIENHSCIREGDMCATEGKIVQKCCRQFICNDCKWEVNGFKGCPRRGQCYDWDSTWEKNCKTFQCKQKGDCNGDVCSDYEVEVIRRDCCVNDECIPDGTNLPRDKKCRVYRCNDGELELYEKQCRDCEGECQPIGSQYTDRCTTYECQAVGQRVRFRPVDPGCSYKDICLNEGDTVMEGCTELICGYDDRSKTYDMVIDNHGCEFNDECKILGEIWRDEDTCTQFTCIYNEKLGVTRVRQRIKGCRVDDTCVRKGTDIKQECSRYSCGKNGELTLEYGADKACNNIVFDCKAYYYNCLHNELDISSTLACEYNGECKPCGSKWKVESECAIYMCKFDTAANGTVYTYIEKNFGCNDFDGNCIYPGKKFEMNCHTYKCTTCGNVVVDKPGCEYKSNCYDVGAEWTDDETCEDLTCIYDPMFGVEVVGTPTGCFDYEGRCYLTNSFKTEEDSCVKYKCHSDGNLRTHVCEYKAKCYRVGETWIDEEDCVQVCCTRDSDRNAVIDSSPYGCMHDNKCRPPGYKYKDECQVYKCLEAGRSFEVVSTACEHKDVCRKINETWFDKEECKEYRCYEDDDTLDIEEVQHGCRDDAHNCLRKEKTEGCIQYTCDDGTMHTTVLGCEYKGRCIPVGETVFNKRKCVEYKCVDAGGQSGGAAVRLVEKWGCLDHDCCYKKGEIKEEDCVTYKCKSRTRSFEIVKAECEWRGKCYTVGSEWSHPKLCIDFTCELDPSSGLAKIKRDYTGCKDKDGECVPFGAKKKMSKCVTAVCEDRDGCREFFPFEAECEVDGVCKAIDSTWIDHDKCVKKICKLSKSKNMPVVRRMPYGCFDCNGVCRPFGHKMPDPENACIEYECSVYETFTPIKYGCEHNDYCYNQGETWKETGTCATFKCRRVRNSADDKIKMRIVKKEGCLGPDSVCMDEGDIIDKGCDQYQCDPSNGGLVIVSEQCRYQGDCYPANSTWVDPDTCTKYKCMYNSETGEVCIVEKQQGCDLGGDECIKKGQMTKEGCNKFVCSAKSNLEPIKTGCEVDGKCRDVGESWEEGCVKYTCVLVSSGPNFAETRVDEEHGCIDNNGKCYHVGETFKKDCVKYKCIGCAEFEEIDEGCLDDDGKCVMPGKRITRDCIEYRCDRDSQSLVPVSKACEWKGECKEVGAKWFDKEKCRGYKCMYDPDDDDVKVVERTEGCSSKSECVKNGGKKKSGNDCVKYVCKNGKFKPTKVGCECGDICIPAGEKRVSKCTTYRCVITSQGPDGIETELKIQHGCYGKDNKCYKVGEEVERGCKVFECRNGGNFVRISSGCMNKRGKCVKPGERVDARDKSYICGQQGNYVPVKKVVGCKGPKGDVQKVGSKYKDGCIIYECQEKNKDYKFKVVKYGCEYNGNCYDVNQVWKSESKCGTFRCDRITSGSSVSLKVSYSPGCRTDGKCLKNGAKWKDGCMTKKCFVKIKRNGKILTSIKVVAGACVERKGKREICHEPGEKWMEFLNNQCLEKKCFVKGKKKLRFVTKVVCKACRDIRGNCRNIGQGDFPALINGKKYRSCDCMKAGNGIKYKCD